MSFRPAGIVVVAVAMAHVACDLGGEVLVAVIQFQSGGPTTCLSLTVSKPDTNPLLELSEKRLVHVAGNDEHRVAVFRGDYPAEVILQARALVGSGCEEPLNPISTSVEVRHRFTSTPDEVLLSIPSVIAPDTLTFRQLPPSFDAGVCVAAVVQSTLDGGEVGVLADTPISFSIQPGSGLTTHTDSTCASVATGTVLAAGTSARTFRVKGQDAGQYTLTASAVGLDAGTIVLDVRP